MAHSRIFDEVTRLARAGNFCSDNGLSGREGLERLREQVWLKSRREVLRGAGAGAALLAAGSVLRVGESFARSTSSSARIAIIGGGMAGLAAADRLESAGIVPVIYEANDRLGGRVRSVGGFSDGLVGEAGGEMIDNQHKTMIAYANDLDLELEDYEKAPGDAAFDFLDGLADEADLVDEYCEMTAAMRDDMRSLSAAPTYDDHTAADAALDSVDLATYLSTRAAGLPLVRGVLEQAYIAEYGLEADEMSCLGMLYFIDTECRAHFAEYGVFSDERYHVMGGNDQIPLGIAARLRATVNTGARLTAMRKTSDGTFALTFAGSSTEEVFDAVIVTIPFTALRSVTLDSSLELSSTKQTAIQTLGYGVNCKTMMQFEGRPWHDLYGMSGKMYSDRANVQTTWQSNWTQSDAYSLLTDYAGGDRARNLQTLGYATAPCGSCHTTGVGNPVDDMYIQAQIEDFLADLDAALPGVSARVSRGTDGSVVSARGHWLPQRYSKGSYTCYLPGQFTGICGVEGESQGLLKFAGEHADSFYDWQGFMEGAANSGIAAADEILADIRAGRL